MSNGGWSSLQSISRRVGRKAVSERPVFLCALDKIEEYTLGPDTRFLRKQFRNSNVKRLLLFERPSRVRVIWMNTTSSVH
jgi:hypothetical protein